jgi:hypothetical protein
MEKAVRIAIIGGIAVLGLALWLGLMGGWSHPAQAAPSATIQSLIDAAPDGGTVSIAAGTYTESLTVDKTITLTGVSSATTIIQAVSGQRVITVTAGHNLRLENLTVTGGRATGDAGGGVYAAGGNLQIVNCRITNNSAEWGGGVFQEGSTGRVDVTGSRIELNTSGSQGGGIFARGSAALTSTLVLSNTAGLYGGGLHVQDGRVDLNGGLFSNNRALGDNGGGVNVNNSISITGTQFISNTSNNNGGALLQWNAGYTVTVINARFERNTAKSQGGGASVAGALIVGNATFVSNTVDSGAASDTFGGGLYAGGDSQISGSTFAGNSAFCIYEGSCSNADGGGLYSSSSHSTLTSVAFSGNRAGRMGGGIGSTSSNLTMADVTFTGNQAGWGGGMYHRLGNLVLTNTLFSGNLAGWGGGMLDESDSVTLTHVTFSGNWASNIGGAMDNYVSNPTLVNCILWGNAAPTGPQIANEYGSTPDITYSDIQGTSVYTGVGNINADPRFIAPITTTAAPTTTGNYHLGADSPVINVGTNAGVASDIDGEPRDAAPDMGADEYRTCWARLNNNSADYGYVQAAVDSSTQPTDVVKVAGYCAGVQARSGVTQTVYVSKTVTIRGGYTTTNWTASDPATNATTLDALGRGRVAFLTGGSGVNVTLENLTVRGGSNSGVLMGSVNATLNGMQIVSNTAPNGGGINASGSVLTVTNSTVRGNTASGWGGGISNAGTRLALINSTLSSNQAQGGNASTDGGGALDLYGASNVTLINSTVSGNTAVITNVSKSGIWLENGALNIQNSIVANNSVTNNLTIISGTFSSQGYNLTNSSAGTPFTATTDLTNTNPLLGPLQNNGGSTWTHALLPSSPAIDRIPFGVNGCGTTITTDQRGQPRPGTFTHLCDIGAYEVQGIYYRVYLPLVIRQ